MDTLEALRLAAQLQQAIPNIVAGVDRKPDTDEWVVVVYERGAPGWITLPDALSVQAYLDARLGSRAVPCVADFGASGL